MENTPKCLHCEADLAGTVEQAIGELVLRCPECGRLNVVAVQLQVLGLI
jgi:phage FluMu protein Com